MIETLVLVLVVLLLVSALAGIGGRRFAGLRWSGMPRGQRGLVGMVILILLVLIVARAISLAV